MNEECQRIDKPLEPGLYVVATPIGQLEDITLRALRVLKGVDAIAAEDTRTAQKLLRAYDFYKPLFSLHRDNEAQRVGQVLERLERGEAVALISEAGTPCISDPGYVVCQAAWEAGFTVIPVPGPTAVTAALSAAGFPTHHFVFLGFLPGRAGRRKAVLAPYLHVPATLVLYESPHKILSLLDDLLDILGDRAACIGRELTKLYEEFLRGTLRSIRDDLATRGAIKGEMVLMIEGAKEAKTAEVTTALDDAVETPEAFAQALLAKGGRPSKLARKLTARFPSLSRRDAYRLLQGLSEEGESSR